MATLTQQQMPETPAEVRATIRAGQWRRPTAGLAPGFAQANLVVLPREVAFDFLLFCQRNPKPCPVLEVLESGRTEPLLLAPGADIRRDLPLYRVYEEGQLANEVVSLEAHWHDDLVSFLLGCSFTFESALLKAGVPVRHLEEDKIVPMYRANVETQPAGVFRGPLVVTMRPIPSHLVARAVQVTSRFPAVHGAPVHVGTPEAIGIRDLARPDWGDAVTVRPGEIPIFWACGVTPQAVALQCHPPLMITHAPGHMLVTDLRDEDLAVL